jgi:hypothetical protein
MSKQAEQEQLDELVDHAVEEFLLVPDERVLERARELEETEGSLALDFDRLMAPILSRQEAKANQDSRVVPAAVARGTWQRVLSWDGANNLARVLSLRPMRSGFATLFLVVVGATLSLPLWRTAPQPDTNNADSGPSRLSRNVPKETSGQKAAAPIERSNLIYIAQLADGSSFAVVAEALDRLKTKYSPLFRDQPLVIRKAESGEVSGVYLGGIGGLKSAQDAEQICSRIRAGGDTCNVVNVPSEPGGR